jgi:2-oxo-4-hydroxy-4-carboxy-5-ureidoimidazoline decarboxylase
MADRPSREPRGAGGPGAAARAARADGPAAGSGLGWLNGLPADDAAAVLRGCCEAPGWARQVAAGRPYRNLADLLAAADRAWAERGPGELTAAMAAHPRIGDRGPGVAGQSRQEQAGVGADPGTLAELRDANGAYERRFGHVFLICAASRGAPEILSELRRRLANDPGTELAVAAGEIGKITALRLRKLAGT